MRRRRSAIAPRRSRWWREPGRNALRAADRFRRQIRIRNSRARTRSSTRALVDRPQLKYILTPHEGPGPRCRGLRESLRRADHRDAGRGRGPRQRHGADVQRVQGADSARFYSYRTDQTRRAGRDGFEEVANSGADRPADDEIFVARASRGNDPGDRPARLKAAWTPPYGRLTFPGFGPERREDLRRDHHPGQGGPAHARAPQSPRSRARRKAPRRGEGCPS